MKFEYIKLHFKCKQNLSTQRILFIKIESNTNAIFVFRRLERERENSIFLNSVQFVEVNQIINEIKSRHCARARKKYMLRVDEKNTRSHTVEVNKRSERAFVWVDFSFWVAVRIQVYHEVWLYFVSKIANACVFNRICTLIRVPSFRPLFPPCAVVCSANICSFIWCELTFLPTHKWFDFEPMSIEHTLSPNYTIIYGIVK